jgi:hypothetical protein
LLVGLASPLWATDPSSGPENAGLRKDESVNMHFYQNKYFSFGMAIPGNWNVILNKQLLWYIHDPYLKEAIKSGLCFPLLAISKYQPGKPGPKGEFNSNIMLRAEDLSIHPPPGIKTTKDFAQVYVDVFKRAGTNACSDAYGMKLGGIEFWRFDYTSWVPGVSYASDFVTVRNGYALTFQLMAESNADITKLEAIMKSLDFE